MTTATYPPSVYGPSTHGSPFDAPVHSHYAPHSPPAACHPSSRTFTAFAWQSNNPYARFAPPDEMSGALQDPYWRSNLSDHPSRAPSSSVPHSASHPFTSSRAQPWRSRNPFSASSSTYPSSISHETKITSEDFLPPEEVFQLTSRDLEDICAGDTKLTAAERSQLTAIAQRYAPRYRAQANQWTVCDWLDQRQNQPGWTNGVRSALSTVDKSQRDVWSVARDFDGWYGSKMAAAERSPSTQSSFVPCDRTPTAPNGFWPYGGLRSQTGK